VNRPPDDAPVAAPRSPGRGSPDPGPPVRTSPAPSSEVASDEAPRRGARSAGARLTAFRISAWVTGVGLVLLVFYAMPMNYVFGDPRPTAIIGMTHGFLYMIYIACTLVLAERCRWRPFEALLVLLAGTVPIASFVAERWVTRRVRAGLPLTGQAPSA
jgi:integral membrane protein